MKPMRALFEQARSGLDRMGERLTRVIFDPMFAFEPCRIPAPVSLPVRRPRPNWRVIAGALLSTLAVLPTTAHAWTRERIDDALSGQLIQVRVKVEGQAAPLYLKPGDWNKRYVQAFRGRHYSLELRNLSGERIGVAISVDGLNVVNGERSSLASTEAMYVLDPYENAEIRGWRTSLQNVRSFVFVDEERSYASRTDQANGDMGWIRVHAFREWRPVSWWQEKYKPLMRDRSGSEQPLDERASRELRPPREQGTAKSEAQNGAPAPSAPEGALRMDAARPAPTAQAFPGTGWGDKRHDPVQQVEFRAERVATDQLTFRYEYESGLRALGIDLRRNRLWEREGGELGFAKPPRW